MVDNNNANGNGNRENEGSGVSGENEMNQNSPYAPQPENSEVKRIPDSISDPQVPSPPRPYYDTPNHLNGSEVEQAGAPDMSNFYANDGSKNNVPIDENTDSNFSPYASPVEKDVTESNFDIQKDENANVGNLPVESDHSEQSNQNHFGNPYAPQTSSENVYGSGYDPNQNSYENNVDQQNLSNGQQSSNPYSSDQWNNSSSPQTDYSGSTTASNQYSNPYENPYGNTNFNEQNQNFGSGYNSQQAYAQQYYGQGQINPNLSYGNFYNPNEFGNGDNAPLNQPLYGATFMQATKRFFKKYARFSGYASRSEYWFATLALILLSLIPAVGMGIGTIMTGVEGSTYNSNVSSHFSVSQTAGLVITLISALLLFILWAATIVPSLAITWRRLHDAGFSGLFFFLSFIPYVGGLILIVFSVLPTKPEARRFEWEDTRKD